MSMKLYRPLAFFVLAALLQLAPAPVAAQGAPVILAGEQLTRVVPPGFY